ncbi:MAG TPA: DUF4199 domain-containing protein [Flavobacteriaceae bacterium]|nr:DUF4199 domain-containing protein [Flavobacteriaceae bacterium]
MEFQKIAPGKFSLSYGLLLGFVMIIISVISYVTGAALEGAKWPQFVYYIIFAIVIFYAVSQYKKKNANTLSLGDALKVGVLIGVISALIAAVYNILFSYVIDPEFMDKAMEFAKEKMIEDNPNMTQEIVDQSMSVMKVFFNPFVLSAFLIAMSALFGLIYSLIAGLIMKRDVNA